MFSHLIHLSVSTNRSPEAYARKIRCPHCDRQCEILLQEVRETGKLFWCIPLLSTTYVEARCIGCNEISRYNQPLSQVLHLTPQELASTVKAQIPFLAKAFILISLVFFMVPIFSVALSVFGFAKIHDKKTKWVIPAILAMLLSSGFTVFLFSVVYLFK